MWLPANEGCLQMSDEVLLVSFLARVSITHEWEAMSDILATLTQAQVVTIKSGPKAYQQHLTHEQAALIRGQPFKETSFMVGNT